MAQPPTAGGGGSSGLAAPAVPQGMSRAAGLGGRLQRLADLVARGSLTAEEAAAVRVPVLAAPTDPTLPLAEAAALAADGSITADEYAELKASMLVQLRK
jgi:hypothetical protein